MRWKIVIKFLYLIALLAYAAIEGGEESRLIDSDPTVQQPTLLHASLQE